MDSVTEVVVVGAGPTGLMLAGDLARAGVGCTVLERRAEVSNLTRAFAVHARTLELLDARASLMTWWPPAPGLVGCGCSASSRWTFPGCPPDFRMCW